MRIIIHGIGIYWIGSSKNGLDRNEKLFMGTISDAIQAAQDLNISSNVEAVRTFVENVDVVCDGLRTGKELIICNNLTDLICLLQLIKSKNSLNT